MRTQVTMLQVIIVMSILAGITCAAAQPMPTINEILDNYTQAMDSTSSFISEYETSSVGSHNNNQWGTRYNNVKGYTKGMYRKDDQGHSYSKEYRWGYHGPNRPDTTEEQAEYLLFVNGDNFTCYYDRSLGGDDKGLLFYREKGKAGWDSPDRLSWSNVFYQNHTNSLFLGYVETSVRLDRILKNANHISLSQKPEMLNGSKCYVVMADTSRGTYKIWFDSEHGYHPAKLQVLIDGEDDLSDPDNPGVIRIPEQSLQQRHTLSNVRFEKIDGIWVPIEADRTFYLIFGTKENFATAKIHFKRTKIILNPDHDALSSFADPMKNPSQNPEFVNGCIVTLGDKTRYTLQDGEMIPME